MAKSSFMWAERVMDEHQTGGFWREGPRHCIHYCFMSLISFKDNNGEGRFNQKYLFLCVRAKKTHQTCKKQKSCNLWETRSDVQKHPEELRAVKTAHCNMKNMTFATAENTSIWKTHTISTQTKFFQTINRPVCLRVLVLVLATYRVQKYSFCEQIREVFGTLGHFGWSSQILRTRLRVKTGLEGSGVSWDS